MKIKKFIYLALIFVMLNTTSIFAETSVIRVGLESLYKDINSCVVANSSISVGYSVDNAYYEGTQVTGGDFSLKTPTTYFVKLNGAYSSYYQVQSIVASTQNAVAGYDDNGVWSVLIKATTLVDANTISSNNQNSSVVVFEGTNAVLYQNDKMLIAFTNKTKNSAFKGVNNEYISIGSRKYRGYLEMNDNSVNKFTLVNVVPFEEYLYAVVPSEMPASWKLEALKAQAVAARTYANTQLTKHSSSGYNICDNEHCQMYLGVGNENANSTLAVDQTRGLEAYYNGVLIETVFSSSSGGITANSEDVWATSLPYLREIVDPYDREGLVWTRSVTATDLSNMLAIKGQNIGTPTSIVIDEKSPNGRVNKLTIVGTTGSYSLTKENIRYFFNYNGLPSLQSRLFSVTSNQTTTDTNTNTGSNNHDVYVTNGRDKSTVQLKDMTVLSATNKTSLNVENVYVMGKDSTSSYVGILNPGSSNQVVSGTNFTISGKGYGHGVGLSQYGAKGMAEDGYTFDQILKFYYKGIDIY